MIDYPDSLAFVLGIIALAVTPVIVQLRARRRLRLLTPPRAQIDPDLLDPSRHMGASGVRRGDDWEGIDRAREKPGAPRPGPRPFDWNTKVPARLLEPGRRPRSGRC